MLPSLRDAGTRRAALVGAVIALGTAPVPPAGTPVLLALLGLFAARRKRPADPGATQAGAAGATGTADTITRHDGDPEPAP